VARFNLVSSWKRESGKELLKRAMRAIAVLAIRDDYAMRSV
jgi:hypothetical protein